VTLAIAKLQSCQFEEQAQLQDEEHDRRHPARESPSVLDEVQIGAAMKRRQRLPSRPGAAAARQVGHLGVWMIDGGPARAFQPETQIGVLPIKEEPFVHASDRLEGMSPDHHAGARDPIHLDRGARIVERDQVATGPRISRPELTEPGRTACEPGSEIREAPCRSLNRAIGFANQGADGADHRPFVEEGRERAWGVSVNDAVGIQQQEVAPGGHSRRSIHSCGESGIVRDRDQPDPREPAQRAWVEEFARLLRPGGILIATTWDREFIVRCGELRKETSALPSFQSHLPTMFKDTGHWLAAYAAGEFCFDTSVESYGAVSS
jgi:hypothetical protein